MGNLTVPMRNIKDVEKTEAQVYLEHRKEVFEYLNKRKTKFNDSRVTPQEILENTSAEKSWEADSIYKDWLRNLGQEKTNVNSSTKKASETTSEKQEESIAEEISTIPSERGEEQTKEGN